MDSTLFWKRKTIDVVYVGGADIKGGACVSEVRLTLHMDDHVIMQNYCDRKRHFLLLACTSSPLCAQSCSSGSSSSYNKSLMCCLCIMFYALLQFSSNGWSTRKSFMSSTVDQDNYHTFETEYQCIRPGCKAPHMCAVFKFNAMQFNWIQ